MSFAPPVVTVTLNPAIDQTISIPSFAAGQVNRVTESLSHAGGKGVNVACVLADLGIEVLVTGFLGTYNPEVFEQTFARKGIVDRFVRVRGATRVGIKIVDPSSQRTTDINFPGLTPKRKEVAELFEHISELGAPDRWFVLSGSVPSGMPDDIYAPLIQSVQGKGGRVLLDTSGRPLRQALASRPEVIKPNVEELSELTGQVLENPGAVRAAAESLLEKGVQLVAVSMGGDGAVFMERGRALLAKPPRVAVRSTVGAGDAMVGGIVASMIQGLPLEGIARMATACGAHAVTRLGAGIENQIKLRVLAEKVEIERLE
jgi:1-phosphofructokinase